MKINDIQMRIMIMITGVVTAARYARILLPSATRSTRLIHTLRKDTRGFSHRRGKAHAPLPPAQQEICGFAALSSEKHAALRLASARQGWL